MRSKKSRLPIGKRNLRIELEATSSGTRTATIAIDVSANLKCKSTFFSKLVN